MASKLFSDSFEKYQKFTYDVKKYDFLFRFIVYDDLG